MIKGIDVRVLYTQLEKDQEDALNRIGDIAMKVRPIASIWGSI